MFHFQGRTQLLVYNLPTSCIVLRIFRLFYCDFTDISSVSDPHLHEVFSFVKKDDTLARKDFSPREIAVLTNLRVRPYPFTVCHYFITMLEKA